MRLEKPVLKKKKKIHPSSQAPGPGPGPVPPGPGPGPAKKDGKFKFTARKPAKNREKMEEKLPFGTFFVLGGCTKNMRKNMQNMRKTCQNH